MQLFPNLKNIQSIIIYFLKFLLIVIIKSWAVGISKGLTEKLRLNTIFFSTQKNSLVNDIDNG